MTGAPARRCEIAGHRGARGLWPENTLAGFAGALALGVDALELDVTLTADGVVVVTHDARLHPDLARDRTGHWLAAPGPRIGAMRWEALRHYDVGRARPGSAVQRAFPRQRPVDGARVPRLAEVLDLVRGTPVLLDVELKGEPGDDAAVPIALADAVLRCLPPACDRVAIRSFDRRGLARVRATRPDLPLGHLTDDAGDETLAEVLHAARRGDAWAPDATALSAASVARAHRSGLAVKAWTVNDAASMHRLIDAGVDGVCTDYPDLAGSVLRARGMPVPAGARVR